MEINLPDLSSELAWIKKPFNQDQQHRYRGKVINERDFEAYFLKSARGKLAIA